MKNNSQLLLVIIFYAYLIGDCLLYYVNFK